ncbi:MAG TPA: hypothetical protein VKS01_09755, partial [Bryobacteraceae bacterium]|nr:hypothetical protein [Bryobacteraceae bacterium]
RAGRRFDAVSLMAALPPDQATHLYIDVAALRKSGILDLIAGSSAEEDADYKNFVRQTKFDYRKDLDGIAGAFAHGNEYFALRGRFDWKGLKSYAESQGGKCVNAICEMPASEPGRYISFYTLGGNALALAVAGEERGVMVIGPDQWKSAPQFPPEPIWISAPPFDFTDTKKFPAGTHSFLSPLVAAQHILFAIGPEGNRFAVRLEVECADAASAQALAKQLTDTTAYLKKMLEREHQTPNPNDLSGVLTAGSFEQKDARVVGKWPLERGFVEALTAGKIE